MKASVMWKAFKKEFPLESNRGYEAWAFGEAPDELAKLVLQGKKTATTSIHEGYRFGDTPLPEVGDLNILLLENKEAVCILRTKKVSIMPFEEVGEDHARKEGEGDLSLEYWREVHQRFFEKEMMEMGKAFSHKTLVVCEEFEIIYPSVFVKRG